MARKIPILFSLFLIATGAFASNYRLDKTRVNALFNAAVESNILMQDEALPAITHQGTGFTKTAANQMTAGFIALVEIVTGVGWLIPFHRIYLGTSFLVVAAYCCTGSGFGILLFGDCIVCLLNQDGDQYIDNDRIFMWL